MSRDNRFTDWDVPGTLRIITPEQCSSCRHLLPVVGWTCHAFPLGIPAAILTNRFDHRQRHPGDKGILYEPGEPPAAGTQGG